MKIPEKLKILGHEYEVIRKRGIMAHTGGDVAICNSNTNEITLGDDAGGAGSGQGGKRGGADTDGEYASER